MNRPLFILLLLLFSSLLAQSQNGYLFVKKGYKKKKIYGEGDRALLQSKDGAIHSGIITMLKNDTIYINGMPLPRKHVQAVFPNHKKKKKFHISAKDFLLITGGVALVTVGLTLNDTEEFKDALATGVAIGYGQIGVQYLLSKLSFRRKKFKIGKKFQLQVLDFHLPRKAF